MQRRSTSQAGSMACAVSSPAPHACCEGAHNDKRGTVDSGTTCHASHLFLVRAPMLSVSLSTRGTTVACVPAPCPGVLSAVSEGASFSDEGPPASMDSSTGQCHHPATAVLGLGAGQACYMLELPGTSMPTVQPAVMAACWTPELGLCHFLLPEGAQRSPSLTRIAMYAGTAALAVRFAYRTVQACIRSDKALAR